MLFAIGMRSLYNQESFLVDIILPSRKVTTAEFEKCLEGKELSEASSVTMFLTSEANELFKVGLIFQEVNW